MKVVAALIVITLLLLVGPLAGPVIAAPPPVPGSGAGPLRLDLAQLTPRIVTADGPAVLTVTGTLTNVGAEPVDGLTIRVQRGDPLRTERELRDALDGSAPTDAIAPQFVELPGELAPGAQAPVRLVVPLRGFAGTSLALTGNGVHELLINVNGVPRDGDRARLAAARLLLPVLSLPIDRDPDSGDRPIEPDSGASGFTLLYPIAHPPRRLPTVPGEPALLTEDDLTVSFSPGGRLEGLVSALATRAPVGSRVRSATCLAVDPDLVATAAAMSEDYAVRTPDGGAVPGTGGEVAKRWLDSLVAAAGGGCVLALPYADADLVALSRGDLDELATRAVTDGRSTLADALGTPVLTGTTWPADGVLDEPTFTDVVAPQGEAVVLSADGVAQRRGPRTAGVLPIAGAGRAQLGVLTDPLLTRAATGRPENTIVGDQSGTALPSATTSTGTSTPLSTQDVIGALAFRARSDAPTVGPLVLAPPHQWAADGTGAAELLAAVDSLIEAGALVPRPLSQVIVAGAPADAGAQPLVYPLRAGAREIPPAVIATARAAREGVLDLSSAVEEGGVGGVGRTAVVEPLLDGLTRGTSAAWRGRPEPAARMADAVTARIGQLRAAVRVLEPPSPYSLGTANAPLLLTVENGLPATMRVRVNLSSPAGLRVAPIPEQEIPPLGRRQVQVSAEVIRSGQFVVQAVVSSPDGGSLGPPSRLRVRSTAYGTITVWLTGSAAVLLVVLVARRVVRRIRGEPGRHAMPRGAAPVPPMPVPRLQTAAPPRPTPGPRLRSSQHPPPARPGPQVPPRVPSRPP
ncbi:MAG: DUF6049 family protein [Pseudonocardia sp.]